jgi:hypothetical protein
MIGGKSLDFYESVSAPDFLGFPANQTQDDERLGSFSTGKTVAFNHLEYSNTHSTLIIRSKLMRLSFDIPAQPTDSTCGPTCLHAVYRYFGAESDLAALISEVPEFDEGGTLSVHLAQHALSRGFSCTLISYNLRVFDPTWRTLGSDALIAKLRERISHLSNPKLVQNHQAYIEYLEWGGKIAFHDLNIELISELMVERTPVITGLSATYLYQSARETPDGKDDDIGGSPTGHFVVVTGVEKSPARVVVADPFSRNPYNPDGEYHVDSSHFMNAVMLGIVTYDANLLVIRPKT